MAYNPFRNLGLKLFALALAVLLWFSVSRDTLVERSLRVPLEYQNIPEGLEIVGDPPGLVDVRLRGTSGVLSRLEPGDVVAVLDLVGARPGPRLFHLLADQVRAPYGAQVAQVTPPTVSLEFEKTGARMVPVVAVVEGEPAPGYVAGVVTCDPRSVEVIGPESRLARLTDATTEPVSVQNATRRVQDRVTVGVTDSALRLKEPRSALVTVEIRPAPIERTVTGARVRYRNLASRRAVRISPDIVSVVLRGSRDRLARVTAESLEVFVDLTALGPGRYTLPLKAGGSEQFGVVRTEPETVQVRIR